MLERAAGLHRARNSPTQVVCRCPLHIAWLDGAVDVAAVVLCGADAFDDGIKAIGVVKRSAVCGRRIKQQLQISNVIDHGALQHQAVVAVGVGGVKFERTMRHVEWPKGHVLVLLDRLFRIRQPEPVALRVGSHVVAYRVVRVGQPIGGRCTAHVAGFFMSGHCQCINR